MSIKKFLFNGSEEKVSKSALDNDIVQELYPQLIVTFTGYTDDLTSPQCDVAFNDIADAFAQGVHISLRHRAVDAINDEIREIDLSPMLTFDSDGVLVRVEGTYVDSGIMFATPEAASFPYDTYINYTNQSLEVYGRIEGNNVVVNPDDPPINAR